MTRFRFWIDLSADVYLHYYQGRARAVIVMAEDGRRIQFPAGRLRPFLLKDGIHGQFEITLDENNKLMGIQRLPG